MLVLDAFFLIQNGGTNGKNIKLELKKARFRCNSVIFHDVMIGIGFIHGIGHLFWVKYCMNLSKKTRLLCILVTFYSGIEV